MLLKDKCAVIYGGGGSIGGAVARGFAREGASVELVGRTSRRLEVVADEIRAAGGVAETAVVDALDESKVDAHAEGLIARSGQIDISLNVISQEVIQGTPLAEMSLDDFMRPVATTARSMFLTARAAARRMIAQRSGVILLFGGNGAPTPNVGGLQVALGAAESLRRALACELGPHGIRVLTLQTGGIPETLPREFAAREAITNSIVGATMLGCAATLDDVANVAAFAASDRAASMTATKLNITCGAEVD